jgi:hypothetical protein
VTKKVRRSVVTAMDVRSLCRAYTEASVRVLGGIIQSSKTPPGVRVTGIALMLERGWGRPPQPVTGANGEGDIRITIRNIIDGGYETIEGDAVVDDVVDDAELVAIEAPKKNGNGHS